jgi:hypothetical protein
VKATLEYGDFKALGAKHLDAKQTGDDAGPKMLYGSLGNELKQ